MGEAIRDIPVHRVHTSSLKRTHETLEEIRQVLGLTLEYAAHEALDERDYGVHTGKDKWQVKEAVGDEEFHNIRRGWDAVVLGGENLKDVYTRVVPYYEQHILPDLKAGHNVLVVAHGNSLRALVKYLDNIPEEHIHKLEIGFGDVYCYEFDAAGAVTHKEIRTTGAASSR